MSGVGFEVSGGVGRITLDRPEVSNAIDLPTAHEFADAVAAVAADEVRVVLLSGAGARFCAGGDVRSFVTAAEPSRYLHELASVLEGALRRLSELPKAVVAGVHGAVAGAGLAFVLNADVVVAARSTKFRMAYSGIGLTPDCGVSYLLPRTVGTQRALELALTGRTLTTEQAQDWGLITEVAEDDVLARRADELATALADGPAAALGQAKRLIRSSFDGSRQRSAADEAGTIAAAVTTSEAQRLIQHFIGK
ncbi:enoyl-CoA hydratase/isomerase family protein [Amycolatopsis acidiphila]|uniref:Enoyl-CoA hydratase/isomerase family protein n=1 Tax=Amycolatopsis acidiphila TaxID=715473 RepID=A0A558AIB1_9PSEU|nr:enoyl-CoA hydratase/isomerase family protein [Amycolatopsis acidiphila]TVT24014.1 enoyl-CoA hydratase/isomerase family protein [Amycolatopsis acidiphila]UIJ57841.1 enoyl-CoA hydratase/isomerase family protein [Amycolatopsis acidiphila]GHG88026.1 enoyl-CoA hydratase [Amycolatopsis acidiphila]